MIDVLYEHHKILKELNTDGSGALTKQDFKAFLESKLELNKDDVEWERFRIVRKQSHAY